MMRQTIVVVFFWGLFVNVFDPERNPGVYPCPARFNGREEIGSTTTRVAIHPADDDSSSPLPGIAAALNSTPLSPSLSSLLPLPPNTHTSSSPPLPVDSRCPSRFVAPVTLSFPNAGVLRAAPAQM